MASMSGRSRAMQACWGGSTSYSTEWSKKPDRMDDPLSFTFCEAIVRGWGVAANCRPCGDVKKLSDRQLAERFIQHLDKPLSVLRGRLKCDCGNKDMMMFTYQAGAMNWPELSVAPSDVPLVLLQKEAILRERALGLLSPVPPALGYISSAEAERTAA
jgi:hypothetical protein